MMPVLTRNQLLLRAHQHHAIQRQREWNAHVNVLSGYNRQAITNRHASQGFVDTLGEMINFLEALPVNAHQALDTRAAVESVAVGMLRHGTGEIRHDAIAREEVLAGLRFYIALSQHYGRPFESGPNSDEHLHTILVVMRRHLDEVQVQVLGMELLEIFADYKADRMVEVEEAVYVLCYVLDNTDIGIIIGGDLHTHVQQILETLYNRVTNRDRLMALCELMFVQRRHPGVWE
jgi:hypothetical protein